MYTYIINNNISINRANKYEIVFTALFYQSISMSRNRDLTTYVFLSIIMFTYFCVFSSGRVRDLN